MPISALQAKILKLISANRSPESHLAGATVLNRADESPPFSQDLDLFHDAAESVAISAERDCETLLGASYDVEWLMRTPAFSISPGLRCALIHHRSIGMGSVGRTFLPSHVTSLVSES